MLIDKIKRQLEYGGYQYVRASAFPCQIMIRKTDRIYAVCLFEDAAVLNGQYVQVDYVQECVRAALEKKFMLPCETLALIISEDIGRDRVLTEGVRPVWLLDWSGRRVVFDNQPGTFDQVEKLLEIKLKSWSGLKLQKDDIPCAVLVLVMINLAVQMIVACQERFNGSSALMDLMVIEIGEFMRAPQYYRLLTAAFLHFGWAHLFNNMLVLLFLGRIAEKIAGKKNFILFYLLCAIGANAASVMWYGWNGEWYVATAGASGAVFAVAGMVLVWIILGRGHLESVSLRQIVMMMIFTVYHGLAEGGVNNCAHITGALLGVVSGVIIWLMRIRKKEETKL